MANGLGFACIVREEGSRAEGGRKERGKGEIDRQEGRAGGGKRGRK